MKRTIHEVLARKMNKLTNFAGHPYVFAALILLVASWFVVGLAFDYDKAWYNILDIFVFLTTFFLIFIVQSSQNADTTAMQLKLDEIINALDKADNTKKGEENRIKTGKK